MALSTPPPTPSERKCQGVQLERGAIGGAGRGQVLFLHVWKTAGSTLGEMAITNGEAFHHHKTHEVLNWTQVRAGKPSFVAYPGPMRPELEASLWAGGGWKFVTMLRDPIEQAISLFLYKCHSTELGCKREALDPWVARGGRNKHWGKARDAGVWFVDNQATRWICGAACDVDTLAEEHFRVATRHLFRFSAILITEDFDALDKHRLGYMLGWSKLASRTGSGEPLAGSFNSHHQHKRRLRKELLGDPRIRSRLAKVQRWDTALYQIARKLAEAQRLAHDAVACGAPS